MAHDIFHHGDPLICSDEPTPSIYYLSPLSILYLHLFFYFSCGWTRFLPPITLALYFHQCQIPPLHHTYLTTHFSPCSYISLFDLLYPMACSTPSNPNHPPPPIKYHSHPVILIFPLGQCIRMEDPEKWWSIQF